MAIISLSVVPSNLAGAQGFLLSVASATWEVDIWGKIRRQNEGARAQYFATEEARRGVMLTLVSEVSQAYFELLGSGFNWESRKKLSNLIRPFSSSSRNGCKEASGMYCRRRAPWPS
jgi:hypothetical protein